jgi:hypothetical protein
MSFNIDEIIKFFPPDLAPERAITIKENLSQFTINNCNKNNKDYTNFYSYNNFYNFLQGDIIKEIRFPFFDYNSKEYKKIYFEAIILSNSCDIDTSNNKSGDRTVILAKVIPFNNFIKGLDKYNVEIKDKNSYINDIKNQQISNIIYLPKFKDNPDYIAYFDQITTIELSEFKLLKEEIEDNKIASLDYFGLYILIFKLTHLLARLPDVTHR